MSRKSVNRPAPWLLSCAKAAIKRSRSAGVKLLAFLRTRTMIGTEPTTVLPCDAWMVTSPLLTLGRPNLPATKNGTAAPLVGSARVSELANAPVVPLRNTTAPPPAADLPVTCTFTLGPAAPEALVTRIWQGDGNHDTNRDRGSALLLILSSTTIVNPPARCWPQPPGENVYTLVANAGKTYQGKCMPITIAAWTNPAAFSPLTMARAAWDWRSPIRLASPPRASLHCSEKTSGLTSPFSRA